MNSTATKKNIIIDFDSTFTKVEALDILCEISLNGKPEKEAALQQIKEITDLGMEGKLDVRESLLKRIKLLNADKSHLEALIEELKKQVSVSFVRNAVFFKENSDHIYIISNGFKDFIIPIVEEFGVKPENVFANSFVFDDNNNIIGFDKTNVLSSNNGKVEQLKILGLEGDICVIGDGYNDYEIKLAGMANKFYAFTENVKREEVTENADHITPSFDEFLYINKLSQTISYPKNRINVLLLENVHPKALKLMRDEGYNVELHTTAMGEEELCEKIKNVSILGIRSKTQVTSKVLANANRLIAIGAFCIGTNQIDLNTCSKKGVAVFNAPFSNTRSVVELVISLIVILMRNLPDKITQMHKGNWDKSANNSFEVRGKKLGIIGYGNIGSQLSVLAESMGIEVYYYDIIERLALGNAKKCYSMNELLSVSDIISLHVDGRPENKNIISKKEFDLMKQGVTFINLSRGHVVDIEALKENIENKKVIGAAIDVFPHEPKNNKEEFVSPLRGLPNTILTPHIGGSTKEAQENIGDFVPNKIMEYVNTGSTFNSVNFPNLQLPELKNAHRLIHIHHNVPGMMAKINIVLAEHGINIMGQYLKTNEDIGYVITDIDKEYDKVLINALKEIEHTIKFRVLY
ncbi:MAG: phosphoglycerate dehydrogenase [Cyclobacteriaceae bacterium]|nr:phosphoglycerate dehydrogenase [Cyclobacteriaceae bacterium]